jgi:diadenosine tetraphosphate (Ap4A) HIT family hydrolase
MWDRSHVTDHIMVVPKRHIEGVAEFTIEEQQEYVAALASYERSGYAFYTRNPGAATKSIPHLHTHAMQLGSLVTPLNFVKVLV